MSDWAEADPWGAARKRFAIERGEKVLDVGCGASPFAPATHLCDVVCGDDGSRFLQGSPLTTDLPFFQASVEALPVADKAFDFVYCTHVLEHVADPAAACRELSRVGRRGYVECPAAWIERLFHAPEHRWLVDHEQGRLTFRELLDEECHDLLGLQYEILPLLEEAEFRAYWNRAEVRRARLVEFYWEGRIDCVVIPRAERKNRGSLRWFYGAPDGSPPAPPNGGPAPLSAPLWRAWRRS